MTLSAIGKYAGSANAAVKAALGNSVDSVYTGKIDSNTPHWSSY